MRQILVVAAFLLVAFSGCVENQSEAEAAPADPSAPLDSQAVTANAADETPPVYPLLIEVTSELRDKAVELVIPAGTYRIVRLVYDAAVWGEEGPWDGSGSTDIGMVYDAEAPGKFMRAFGFARPSWVDDGRLQPWIDVYDIEGSGWSHSYTSSSGGDQVPAHETAWLMGSMNGSVTMRVGVGIEDSVEELWAREALPVRAEAETTSVWGGGALTMWVLANEYQLTWGDLTSEFGGSRPVPGAELPKTSLHTLSETMLERGYLGFDYALFERAGTEEWGYNVQGGGHAVDFDGQFIHAPYSSLLALAGVVDSPVISWSGTVDPGPFDLEFHRAYTGAADPSGLAAAGFELAGVAHVGLDFPALYNWNVARDFMPSGADQEVCFSMSSMPYLECLTNAGREIRNLAPGGAPHPL